MPPPPPPPRGPEMDRETLSSTPSFRRSSDDVWPGVEEESGRTASPLAELPALDSLHDAPDATVRPVEGNDDDEFEFAMVSGDAFDGFEPITADEIFFNGQIRPLYPLFGHALVLDNDDAGEAEKAVHLPLRKLMMDDGEPQSTSSSSTASSESDELEGIPADSYCLWAPGSVPPSPDHLRKRRHSMGDSSSASRRWRLRDLVIGRSHSDGQKKFIFLAAAEQARKKQPAEGPAAAAEEGKKKVKGRVAEMDMVTAYRIYYGKGGTAATGERRRSFLPYRTDLIGFHPLQSLPLRERNDVCLLKRN